MYKYKNLNIQEIVKDKDWQITRKKLLNKWIVNPQENVSILRQYLNRGSGTKQLRALRIYNYLTGTAFRLGLIKNKEIDKLKIDVRRFI